MSWRIWHLQDIVKTKEAEVKASFSQWMTEKRQRGLREDNKLWRAIIFLLGPGTKRELEVYVMAMTRVLTEYLQCCSIFSSLSLMSSILTDSYI